MTGVAQKVIELSDRGRLPHGMLWIGPDPEQKRAAAMQLAAALFCSDRRGGPACGSCLSCRKISKGQHPDLRFVAAEGKEIRIEAVRDLSRWLNIAPNEAPRKIGVVDEADLLNASASNALLKTLEEPPAHALALLLVRSGANVLLTIRSRLMPLRFPAAIDETPLESDRPAWGNELERVLKAPSGVPPDELFDLTETIAKDKEHLRWFFWATQSCLWEELRNARETGSTGRSRRLEALFDLSVATERDILHRYGNTALGLDRLLTQWLL